jgi:hypothetical protein
MLVYPVFDYIFFQMSRYETDPTGYVPVIN